MRKSGDHDEELEMYPLPLLTEASIRAVNFEGPDGEAVHRLAALSGRKAPTGAVLLAEKAGDPVAVIGIFDGNVITDRVRSDLRY